MVFLPAERPPWSCKYQGKHVERLAVQHPKDPSFGLAVAPVAVMWDREPHQAGWQAGRWLPRSPAASLAPSCLCLARCTKSSPHNPSPIVTCHLSPFEPHQSKSAHIPIQTFLPYILPFLPHKSLQTIPAIMLRQSFTKLTRPATSTRAFSISARVMAEGDTGAPRGGLGQA